MTHTSFLAGLKRNLPEDVWPWVIPALRQDAVVWNTLDTLFGLHALESAAANPSGYSPAALALLALNLPITVEDLRSSPMQAGLPEVEDEPAPAEVPDQRKVEDDTSSQFAGELARAGMQALQIREKRRTKGTWEDLPREIGSITPTAMACLYGMLPDPAEMLEVLIFTGGRTGMQLALHALLSNPLQPAEHAAVLSQIAGELSHEKRLGLLRSLAVPRADLAAALAGALLKLETGNPTPPSQTEDYAEQIDQLTHLLRFAEYYTKSNQAAQAVKTWNAASQAAQRLQAQLSAQLACSNTEMEDHQAALTAWDKAIQLDPNAPNYIASNALALMAAGRSADAQSRLGESPFSSAHPWTLLANARLALLRGNLENAEAGALRSVEILDYMAEQGNMQYSAGCRLEAELGSLLLELNQPQAANRIIGYALDHMPNDPHLLSLAAQAYLAAHELEEAVSSAHLAAALAPARVELRQQLAGCMERAGMWGEALQERSLLANKLELTGQDELRDLAACALQAGEIEHTLEICQRLIEQDETDGLACVLYGEASARQGDKRQAFEYLMRAVHYAPDQSCAWLSLARLYNEEGMLQKALDTLQSASRAAPDLAEIQLALGEALLNNGAPSQALGALRRAAELSAAPTRRPEMTFAWQPLQTLSLSDGNRELADRVALRLGQTLLQLGHYKEAQGMLEAGYNRAPADPELARTYARSLLVQGQTAEAIPPLKALLESEPADAVPYMDFTRCVLANLPSELANNELAAALKMVQRGLEIEPDNAEAAALLAETLTALKDLAPALDAYQKSLETNLAQDPAWLARLSLGLGQVALQLGQVETAIAALQGASQAAPGDAKIQQRLSEAVRCRRTFFRSAASRSQCPGIGPQ